MCSIAAAGLVITGLSTVASTVSGYQQARAQQAQFRYQAQIQRNNQIAQQYQAEDAIKRGKIEKSKVQEKTQQLIGRQRSIYGAAGLQLDSGTPLLVQEDTAELGAYDALQTENNAEREAYAHLLKAQQFSDSANLAEGAASSVNPLAAAGGSLLTGLGDLSSKYAKFKFYKG